VTSASTSPVAGFFVAKVSPGAVKRPSMKCPKTGPLVGDPVADLGVAFGGGAVVHVSKISRVVMA
jgi:hypothetical protein